MTVADINPDMLAVGIDRARARGLDGLVWAEENAGELSFPSAARRVTIAPGICNVTHIDRALAEAFRALKTGGRFYCLEFSQTRWPGFREAYRRYSRDVAPRLGRAVAGDPGSTATWSNRSSAFRHGRLRRDDRSRLPPGQAEPILGGLVAIHSGWKV